MLYAKKDIYAMDGEVRRFIAPAGAAVPKLFEKLVDKAEVSDSPVTVSKAEKVTGGAEADGTAETTTDKDEAKKAPRRRSKAE